MVDLVKSTVALTSVLVEEALVSFFFFFERSNAFNLYQYRKGIEKNSILYFRPFSQRIFLIEMNRIL